MNSIIKKREKENVKNTNPKNIKFCDYLSQNSYSLSTLCNAFCLFKSINDIIYLVYIDKNNSIICYNLINKQIINEIKNINGLIKCLKYYLDKINKRDLIISIFDYHNAIKIWNINNFECLFSIKNINISGSINSVCVLNDNNQNYIVTSNINYRGTSEPIKIFNFNGIKVKEIKDSYEQTYSIDTYYDNKLCKYYIFTSNDNYAKSYDYNENKMYHKYNNNNEYGFLINLIIRKNKKLIELIGSTINGYIIIWNFHTRDLLKTIRVGKQLYGICLWNKDYLFVGCFKLIKLIDIKNGMIIKTLNKHEQEVVTIKKITHPIYGECLISHGINDIILWTT